ncbi:8788_t:CDS:2 [Gigaspora rosea]|nr:8788_t:CDS:2 [Gigaspora rosea]
MYKGYIYSSPLPSRVPNEIINKLKTIIEEASKELINIIP